MRHVLFQVFWLQVDWPSSYVACSMVIVNNPSNQPSVQLLTWHCGCDSTGRVSLYTIAVFRRRLQPYKMKRNEISWSSSFRIPVSIKCKFKIIIVVEQMKKARATCHAFCEPCFNLKVQNQFTNSQLNCKVEISGTHVHVTVKTFFNCVFEGTKVTGTSTDELDVTSAGKTIEAWHRSWLISHYVHFPYFGELGMTFINYLWYPFSGDFTRIKKREYLTSYALECSQRHFEPNSGTFTSNRALPEA